MSVDPDEPLAIVGGIYRERCMRPRWNEVFGSAGRAAAAIVGAGGKARLHGYVDATTFEAIQAHAALGGFELVPTHVDQVARFHYVHGLARPTIREPVASYPAVQVSARHVLQFGTLETLARVECERAVYDPQNVECPQGFRAAGSRAGQLALVLNQGEARSLLGGSTLDTDALAARLVEQEGADVVVMKRGPLGELIWEQGQMQSVPAFRTPSVWKIGSGDHFATHFARAWLQEGMSATQAAQRASIATAYYCQHAGFPTAADLAGFAPNPIVASARFLQGRRPLVYLAGPFFTLAQLWLIEQARSCLRSMGVEVFSPFHDVGHGPAEAVVDKDLVGIRDCDVMLAVGDDLDSGTIYEVGYARALDKPVIVYAENESDENLKMMEGSHCTMSRDFVSAIYLAVWEAMAA
jgi:nucleoside 2-deoxyribosyltransferase